MKPGVRRATARQVHVRRHRLAPRVHLEDLLATGQVRRVDGDLPVEPAGPQQRRVEHVGPVGGRDQDHTAADVEAVHLDQQLVQGLLALVVTTAEARTTVPADGVDLVDEHDRRGVRLGLLEQVADPGGTDTDEHLDEVRTGDRVERHAGLTGDRTGQQGLTGTGLAVEQHALRDLRADRLELARLLQELLDLAELLDRLVAPGHVREGGLRGVLGDQLGLRLGEAHHPRAAALHRVHQEDEDDRDQQERDQRGEHLADEARLRVLDVVPLDLLVVEQLLDRLAEGVGLAVDPVRAHLGAVGLLDPDLLVGVDQRHRLDRLVRRGGGLLDQLHDLPGRLGLVPGRAGQELSDHQNAQEGDDDPEQGSAEDALHVHDRGLRPVPPSSAGPGMRA